MTNEYVKEWTRFYNEEELLCLKYSYGWKVD